MRVGATAFHLCRISGLSGNTQWKSISNLTIHRSQYNPEFSYPRKKLTGEASHSRCIETPLTGSKMLLLKGKYHSLYIKNYFFSVFFFLWSLFSSLEQIKKSQEQTQIHLCPLLVSLYHGSALFYPSALLKELLIQRLLRAWWLVKHGRKCITY